MLMKFNNTIGIFFWDNCLNDMGNSATWMNMSLWDVMSLFDIDEKLTKKATEMDASR